jgi:hypothetical protein
VPAGRPPRRRRQHAPHRLILVWRGVDRGLRAVQVDDRVLLGVAGDQRLGGEVVQRSWDPAAGAVQQRDRVLGEQRVLAAGQLEVMMQVAGGLGVSHAGQLVADRDPLIQRGERAHPQPLAQGRLTEQDPGERAL